MRDHFTPFAPPSRPEIVLPPPVTLRAALISRQWLMVLLFSIAWAAFVSAATITVHRLAELDRAIAMENV